MKANNNPQYVHASSNHPPSILRSIPSNINRRLSNISSDETVFNNTTQPYQTALNNSGYTHQLSYNHGRQQNGPPNRKRSRKRKITWYNPPFDMRVKTNVGKQFLRTVDECFPRGHVLRPIDTSQDHFSVLPKSEGRRALTKQFCRVKKQENQPLPVSLLQLVVKIEHSKKTEG